MKNITQGYEKYYTRIWEKYFFRVVMKISQETLL